MDKALTGVLSPDSLLVVGQWRKQLENALERVGAAKEYHFDWILGEVEARRMQVWQDENSLVITRVIGYPKRKILEIFVTVSTDLDISKMDVLKRYAAYMECTAIKFYGRKGWARRFPEAETSMMYTIEV